MSTLMGSRRRSLTLATLCASLLGSALPCSAHDDDSAWTGALHVGMQALDFLFPTAAAEATISAQGIYRVIESDGLPDHATGSFPNRGNPHRISAQRKTYRVPLNPTPNSAGTTPLRLSPFGVAINGVVFDPGAAEFWNDDRNSGWQYEALGGAVKLGMDASNAHVQPSGAYHYHGIPSALLQARTVSGKPTLLGYAADGFPIYGPSGFRTADDPDSGLVELASSYRVRAGQRRGGPGGRYDGSFVQDYEYAPGSGDLDACNGRVGVVPEYPDGTYHYVLTRSFPFIPRCFHGTPDRSFQRAGGGGGSQQSRQAGGSGQGQRNNRQGPPQEALAACSGRSDGARCEFQGGRGRVSGTCRSLGSSLACAPSGPPPR